MTLNFVRDFLRKYIKLFIFIVKQHFYLNVFMGKRITKIFEKELATLIQQSIDSYFAEHDDNSEINPRINTEIPSIPNFLNVYQDDELIQQMIDQNNLNEGLIRTYPIETSGGFFIYNNIPPSVIVNIEP